MAFTGMPRVHSQSACSDNFQELAVNLTMFLMQNPPNYDAALQVLGECDERRRLVGATYGGLNAPHLAVVNLINNLYSFLNKMDDFYGRPMLTVNYVGGPHRFHFYDAQNQVMTVRADGIFQGQLGGKRNRRNTRKSRKNRKNTRKNRKN